jgi:LmbE family N-acetylglucosaminyl deacetylase
MRVLVIGCHPDDETLGAGGTVIRHINQGDDVSICILTDGVGARHERKEQQKECAEKACAILGVHDVTFCDLPDQGLDAMPLLDVIRPIEQRVSKFVPNIVYTHFAGDVNQDHRAAFQATTVACRSVATSPVERVLCYETASSTEWAPPFPGSSFTPNVYVDIDDELDQKIEAMTAYAHTHVSEVKPYPHPRSYEAIAIHAQSRGIAAGMKAAEAFALVRERIKKQGRAPWA